MKIALIIIDVALKENLDRLIDSYPAQFPQNNLPT